MATLKDIAKKLNISTSTISRVLNYDPTIKVKDDTRNLIFETAKDMGYIKKTVKSKNNFLAKKIGIVHWYTLEKELTDPFYISLRIGVESSLNKQNLQIIRVFKDDANYYTKLLDLDGLICIGKFSKKEIAELRKLNDNIIFLDLILPKTYVSTVSLDFYNAIYSAMDYLYNLGHRNIGYLGGREYTSDNEYYEDKRIVYFRKYCKEHNILNENFILEDTYTIESGYKLMDKLIKSNNLPTAIFCANDLIAQGAMRAAIVNKIKIPEDISIIGFNNDKGTDFTNPPLTTINAPSSKIGEFGAHMISLFLNQKKVLPVKIEVPCDLVIRDSCAPI